MDVSHRAGQLIAILLLAILLPTFWLAEKIGDRNK